MKRLMVLLPIILLMGCKNPFNAGTGKSGALIDMTSAGMDIYCTTNTITGIQALNLMVKVLEKYNKPLVAIDEVVGMKSYPSGTYSKTVKKYNDKALESISVESINPLPSEPNNLPFVIAGIVFMTWIFGWVMVKLLKK